MPRSRPAAAAPVVAALLSLAGCGQASDLPVSDVRVADRDGLHGVVLPTPYDVPHVALVDTAGTPYRLDRDATRPVTLVFFGYTHCPDICQIVMANLASALTRLDRAARQQVAVLFVTTDPARDDPQTLRRYLDRFNPDFEGLTGPLSRIVAAGRMMGVPVGHGARLPSGGYDVEHGTAVVAVLPDGTAPVVWTEGTPPTDIAADLTRILDTGVPSTGSSQ